MILAIDPGNIESAYCFINVETYKPIEFGKVSNKELEAIILCRFLLCKVIIEMIASYGMAVGVTVFDTCVQIGRFTILADNYEFIYRKEEKLNLCGTMQAKDNNIRQALIDRFGVVGIKSNPGWFYGFKADIWSAYAVGVTYLDKERKRENNKC